MENFGNSFSFLQEPVPLILSQAKTILPGIEKIVGIHYSGSSHKIEAKVIEFSFEQNIELNPSITEHAGIINKYRSSLEQYSWLSPTDVPFDYEEIKSLQMDVFAELNNTVLLCCFENPIDHKKDLIFAYFRNDFGAFGLSNSAKVLTTEHKAIIGSLVYNSFSSLINLSTHDRSVLTSMNKNTHYIIDKYANTAHELEIARKRFAESITAQAKMYLSEKAKQRGFHAIELSDNAEKKLQQFTGSEKQLYQTLDETITFLSTLYYGSNMPVLMIDDVHINIKHNNDSQHTTSSSDKTAAAHPQYAKTLSLLDKLEKAAEIVSTNHKELTSFNVGSALDTPISAPAISDAMKKHGNKIVFLLNQYPNRWKLIRNDFRPIRNLLQSFLKSA